MNKREVAAELGLSIRSVEAYSKKGRLSVRYEKGARGDVAVYDASEVRQLKAELQKRPPLVPAVISATPEPIARRTPEIATQSLSAASPLTDYLSRIAAALEADSEPVLLTSEEVCERLKVGETTLRKLVREGKLKAVHVGRLVRFRPDDLRRFIEEL